MSIKKIMSIALLSLFMLENTAMAGEQDLNFDRGGSNSHNRSTCGAEGEMANKVLEKRVNFQMDVPDEIDTSNSGLFSDYEH